MAIERFALAVCAAAFLALPSAAADSAAMKAIKAACADKWPGDYEMQAYCIDQQSEAAVAVQRFMDQHAAGTEPSRIVYVCATRWKSGPGDFDYDWTMVMYCTERQMEAYRRISR